MYLKSILHMGSLMLHFRNGATLVERMRAGQPCDVAVLWDGTQLTHPAGREGLLEALQEIWLERVYTGGFYRPSDGDVIVDAGANVGIFSIFMARQNRRCRVVALEPFAENFRYLQNNITRAGLRNVTCCETALGAAFGEAQMQAVGTRSLDHVLTASSPELRAASLELEARASQPGTVAVIPLSGLFELASADEIDFLKVDIEGSERDVFAAASPDVLRRIHRIAMEYHDCIVPGTLDLLRTLLAPSHEIMVRPSKTEGSGILFARRRL